MIFTKPPCFREFLSGDVNELAFLLADNIPGRYFSYLKEPEFLSDVEAHLRSWCNDEKVGLFRSFHLLKEKDEGTMLEKWGIDNTTCFLKVIQNVMNALLVGLYDTLPIDTDTISYSKLAVKYSAKEVIDLLEVLESHITMLGVKGRYTANDYLNLVMKLAV